MKTFNWHIIIGWLQMGTSVLTAGLQVASQPGWLPNQQGIIILVIALCNGLSGLHKAAEIKPVGG